jgi:hypothetical protein
MPTAISSFLPEKPTDPITSLVCSTQPSIVPPFNAGIAGGVPDTRPKPSAPGKTRDSITVSRSAAKPAAMASIPAATAAIRAVKIRTVRPLAPRRE